MPEREMSMTCAEKLSPHDEKDEVKHDADLAAPAAIFAAMRSTT
jgi:hypothetical protein